MILPEPTVVPLRGGPTLRWGVLAFQTTAIAQHIADGRTEVPEHPLDVSVAILETLDSLRAQVEAG